MSIAAIDRAGARGGMDDTLATLAGALLLFLTVVLSLIIGADIVGRYALGLPFLGGELIQSIETYFGIGFAAISLLALPAALAASFARQGNPPMRSRSALALVPGCLLGLAATLLGVVLYVAVMGIAPGPALLRALNSLASTFSSYVFLLGPIVLVLAAALGGARTPEATATAAAPTALIWLYGFLAQVSITDLFAVMFVPLLLLALVFAVLYAAAPARAVTPLMAGTLPPVVMALPLAVGILTPTESMAFVAIFGLAVALPVRAAALRQPLAPMLRQAGMEMAAIVTVLAAAILLSQPLAFSGVTMEIAETIATSSLILPLGALAFFALSYILTPAFTLAVGGVLMMVTIVKSGADPVWAGAVLTLTGLAAMLARSGRANASASLSLPNWAAWIASGVTLAVAILVALVPDIAMSLAKALQ